MREIVEVTRQELMVITAPVAGESLVIENREVEVMEVARQGDPGPPGESESQQYDTDLVLIYQTAKL